MHVLIAAALVTSPGWSGIAPAAAVQSPRLNDDEVRALLDRIEEDADRFERSLKDAVDQRRADPTWRSDEMVDRYVDEFEDATERLEDRFRDGRAATGLVQEVLRRGAVLDRFVAERPVGAIAQRDWMTLRSRLDDLAFAYGVRWDWTTGAPAAVAPAQRLRDDELARLVDSLEKSTDAFRERLDDAIEDGPADDTATDREADALMKAFDEATDDLHDRFDTDDPMGPLVSRIVREAERLDDFVRRHRLSPQARADWEHVRALVRELAGGFGVYSRL
jgi:hypothetical protein